MSTGPARRLAARLPFFYGWVVVGCAMTATFARQGAAVATLSVFIAPMTAEFGWSRTGISGAVSLGAVLGALAAPMLGRLVDRHGARAILVASTLVMAAATLSLAGTTHIAWFYVAFGIGRLTFSTPFDLGISAAVTSWFVVRRARAMSAVTAMIGISLAIMPLMAQRAIDAEGWRSGWLVVAISVLLVGALPNALLMVRRPEDIGLLPDGAPPASRSVSAGMRGRAARAHVTVEHTVRSAMRTPSMWLLMAFSALIFPVQAGVSLHQAPHLVERGLSAAAAASVVATFSLSAALASPLFGILGDRLPVRFGLAAAAAVCALGVGRMPGVERALDGHVAGALFGAGIGGLLTLLPVAFADYFGRERYGAIRGAALTVQVLGQATGPLLAGVLRDLTGDYTLALRILCGLALGAALVALAARPPAPASG